LKSSIKKGDIGSKTTYFIFTDLSHRSRLSRLFVLFSHSTYQGSVVNAIYWVYLFVMVSQLFSRFNWTILHRKVVDINQKLVAKLGQNVDPSLDISCNNSSET